MVDECETLRQLCEKNRDQCETNIAAKNAIATREIRRQFCKTHGFEGLLAAL